MNRLEALRLFCAAAESGNFRQTARLLGVSPQAVTRAVQQSSEPRIAGARYSGTG